MKTPRSTQPPLTLGAWMRFELVWDHLMKRGVQDSVLEMGCGLGALGARLASELEYTGCEADATSRAEAEKAVSPRPVLASLDELPADSAFGAIVACEVVEHIEHDAEVLAEWRSHLKPGGAIVLSIPAYQERFGPSDKWAGHFRRYSPAQIEAVLSEAGFVDVSVDHYGFPVTEVLEPLRNMLAKRSLSQDQSLSDATAASARILQPNAAAAPATRLATAPFRALQRRGRLTSRGAGLVASAVSPSA